MTKTKRKKSAAKCSPLSVRVTPEERESLLQKAGDMPLSEYVRGQLFGAQNKNVVSAPTTQRISPAERQRLLAQILVRLGEMKTAQHLGGLVDAIRSGITDADPELISSIKKLRGEFKTLRFELLKALGLRP
jgi:hypothetical protein